MKRNCLLALCLAVAPRAVLADPLVWVQGIGIDSCAQYLRAVREERKAAPANSNPDVVYTFNYAQYLDFTDGFLSGANTTDTGQKRLAGQTTDRVSLTSWLEKYCGDHPLDPYFTAVEALRDYLVSHGR